MINDIIYLNNVFVFYFLTNSTPKMNSDSHFLPPENLVKVTNKKIDFDVIKNTQSYSEKVITDIINRSALLVRHADSDTIDVAEISIIVEKDFDYSFGLRNILVEKNLPSNEHVERMAELSRQK